jgi:hypothetical protein
MGSDQARSGGPAIRRQPSEDETIATPRGLGHPRAVDILTTEHWSLLSTRTLASQEMFGRATLYTGILSATVVALAFLAQATHFGRALLSIAALLLAVALLIGVFTFARAVEINYEDARCVAGMDLLHDAYLEVAPELERYFIKRPDPVSSASRLSHGSKQRFANLTSSLTTTSSVIAALNSILFGAFASDVSGLLGLGIVASALIGAGASVVSAALHVRHAAHFRRRNRV